MIINLLKALRAPFLSVSVLAYIYGAAAAYPVFDPVIFFSGMFGIVFMHSGANLLNDYYDALSGVDGADLTCYGFFGGSKFIQKGVFSLKQYMLFSRICFICSFLCAGVLYFTVKDVRIVYLAAAALLLSWGYSKSLSYAYLGELTIFLMFGPLLVLGAHFLQTGVFFDAGVFMLSIPAGLLSVGILLANEIPDYPEDKKYNKKNFITIAGPSRGALFNLAVNAAVFVILFFLIVSGELGMVSILSFGAVFPAVRAYNVQRRSFGDKTALVVSSKSVIQLHSIVLMFMIMGLIWKK